MFGRQSCVLRRILAGKAVSRMRKTLVGLTTLDSLGSSSSSFLFFFMSFSGVGFFFFTYGSFIHLVGLLGRHRETQTHIHAPSRIRNCDPNVRAAEDSTCLRPRGH
jgi:hypothetical protein